LHEKTLAALSIEVVNLERRRRLASWAINFCTGAALLVCIVIIILFFAEFMRTDLRWLAGALFVTVMFSLVAGLSCFLREVYLATHTVRIDPDRFVR
jgi:Na+/melibiose symporter-like transporter